MIIYNSPVLYSRTLSGSIVTWRIECEKLGGIDRLHLYRSHIGSEVTTVTTNDEPNGKGIARAKAKVKLKRTKGYKDADDINPRKIYKTVEEMMLAELEVNKTDADNRFKPMKAKPFQSGKFGYPCLAQPKLNGNRFKLRWEVREIGEGMFKEFKESAVFRTMEGHEMYLPHISDSLPKELFENDYVFDGEMYIHGKSLNYIASCIPKVSETTGKPSNPSGNPLELTAVVFDLAMEDILQEDRINMLEQRCIDFGITIFNEIYPIETIKDRDIVCIPTFPCKDDEDAKEYRDLFILQGFEGVIIRNPKAEYQFGGRVASVMMKYKKPLYVECKIIDIVIKNTTTTNDKDRTFIAFVCQNDINDAIFDVTPEGDEAKRMEYYVNRASYTGRKAYIQYYERTGVKKVPYHCNVIKVL